MLYRILKNSLNNLKKIHNQFAHYILFIIIAAYYLLITYSTFDIFDKNISAEKILFNGKFIKLLNSSPVESGRFVPFSNIFNILLFKQTDNFLYFIILNTLKVILNFYILKKIFDYLKISKYFVISIIIVCYNHAFLNGQYITTAEGDISLLLTILFYIDLKISNRKTKIYELFLKFVLMILLLGLKESMLIFFTIYACLKIFFFKNENLFVKITYLIILVLYIYFYYKFIYVNINSENIYGSRISDASKLFSTFKLILHFTLSFPLIFFFSLFILNSIIKNFFLIKNKILCINDIYFFSGFGYLLTFILLDIFAFRYVLPLIFIVVPLFFVIYDKISKKKIINISSFLIFVCSSAYSNTIELINNFENKKYNNQFYDKLNNFELTKNVSLIYNWEFKEYLLRDQYHDRSEVGNMLIVLNNKNIYTSLFFVDYKNINNIFLENEIIISLIRSDLVLHKKIEDMIAHEKYNITTFERVIYEPILIKQLLRSPAKIHKTSIYIKR